ncbi:MAG: isoleucine--tRNA ligase [Bacteroidetes Order II. Incertae sedis bacterium]|nr:isoleucine--tRNA ligase [Bacteroidetes Order II. bacterium]
MNKRFPEAKQVDFPALEQQILDWWKAERIFERSIEERSEDRPFTFYEGPPTANGKPGIHHVMARTIKDTFCRYQSLKGKRVNRKAGWDTHGLPVEIEVEKRLGIEGRHKVEEFGIEAYNKACKNSVLEYTGLWHQLTERMGYWVDMNDPYITYETAYIESVWWLLKQIYDKGLLFKGYKIQWYSPGSNTVLSSHEVSLGYKEVQDPAVFVRFPLDGEENTSFLAWTTTPWTLISNTALAVHQNIDYVKIRHVLASGEMEYLILAKNRLSVIKDDYEIVSEHKGAEFLGLSYEPPFDYFVAEVGKEAAWRVIHADFITDTDGTGVAHEAPAFGADDYNAVVLKEKMPLFNPVKPDGTFEDRITLVAGMHFKEADKVISRKLKEQGNLFRLETYLHNYPHDWRKGTPLMQYPMESWFIRTSSIKDRLVALNKTINWQPETIGTGRFGQWLENNVDWALSRSRYWGTPLPIWVAENDPEYVEMIGSVAELRKKCGTAVPEKFEEVDLHRPYVDQYTWDAPAHIGGKMKRIPDLIDVWFDSGAMPFAQWHYPFENKEKFEASFPADFIAEGVDQTRGWFYSLHAIAALVMDDVAYKNVVSNGLLLDEKGEKMSKSKGNVVDPFKALAEHGADPVRWYMMSNSQPWEDLKFSFPALEITKRKFFLTLANTYSFFETYANVDGFAFEEDRVPVQARAELDRWILSRLNTTLMEVDVAFAAYHPTRAARAIEQFVDELSNWYIRRSRRRFWKSEQDSDKLAAFQTVYECLESISIMMSPIAPFYSDWLFKALNDTSGKRNTDSVHLAHFPVVEKTALDPDLEHRMGLARTLSSVVLSLRNQVQINVRQPLEKMLVVLNRHVDRNSVEQVKGIILDEVNLKSLDFITSSSDVVKKSIKPNFRVLGKKVGGLMKVVQAQILKMTATEIETFEREGTYNLTLPDGSVVGLIAEDVDVLSEGVAGWLVGSEGLATVALDTNISPALRAEGLSRELVNRIQNLRKSANLDVTDRIQIGLWASDDFLAAIEPYKTWVMGETLATGFSPDEIRYSVLETFEIGNEHIRVALTKL